VTDKENCDLPLPWKYKTKNTPFSITEIHFYQAEVGEGNIMYAGAKKKPPRKMYALGIM
jgi:hypothetical protein